MQGLFNILSKGQTGAQGAQMGGGLLDLLGLGGGERRIPGPPAQGHPMQDQPQQRPGMGAMGMMGLMDFLKRGSGFGTPTPDPMQQYLPDPPISALETIGPGALGGQGLKGLFQALIMGAPKKAKPRTGKGLSSVSKWMDG